MKTNPLENGRMSGMIITYNTGSAILAGGLKDALKNVLKFWLPSAFDSEKDWGFSINCEIVSKLLVSFSVIGPGFKLE